MDLFTKQMQVGYHKETDSEIIIERSFWNKRILYYDCLVPEKDDKGKYHLCNATYTDLDLEFNKRPGNGIKIEIEKL